MKIRRDVRKPHEFLLTREFVMSSRFVKMKRNKNLDVILLIIGNIVYYIYYKYYI